MKPKSIIIIVAIILALVLIKVFFLKPENTGAPKGTDKKLDTTSVSGYVVRSQLLENKLFASGTVAANESIELHPEVSGKITAIYFKEGSTVRKGTLLAKINDVDLQAQLRKLQLQLKLSNERKARLKGLLEIGGVSQDEYDATANLSQTIAADMDYTRAQIAKTEIRAPFDGKIGLKQVSEGAFVSSTNIIASIQETGHLKIDFSVPEKYASIVAIGDVVDFTVENKEGQFQAKVFAIEPKIDQQTRNIMIRAVYSNTQTNIFPGTFAKVELIAKEQMSALMIPTEAVIPELKGKKVFAIKGGKATPVKVSTGTRTDAMIEIVNGLAEGDTVITTGIMSLKPDAAVKIIGFKK